MGNELRTRARRVLLQQIAPSYHDASGSQKKQVLEEFVSATGYARKYALWLLHHAEEVFTPTSALHRRYGPEVEEVLVLIWKTLNRICTKRLIPFLPDILEMLEKDGHVHLSQEHRGLLLSMSAATADRLLQAHRYTHPHGLSTTKAGPLLKQQIPIRTFAQWDEAKPGFLEVDLVTHCGSHLDGSFLSTLTLTDIATGWTECMPLRTKSAEAVVSALQQARTFFPFPILGVDTDNGCEFINDRLLAYCDAQQITFTRGREGVKNDQNFVEQKNGAVVRQVVGYARFEGEQVCRQLGEVYQALCLYVNGFQPSMKLQAKQYDGRKVRRIYDAAKTPLQRLLLFHVLPTTKEQELQRVAQVLDPLRLFRHLQELQQALLCFRASASSGVEGVSMKTMLLFGIERCLGKAGPVASQTEEGEEQKQAVPVFAPDLLPSCQPGQDAKSTTLSLGREMCSAQIAPSQYQKEERVLPSQPLREEKEIPCPLTPANGGAAQGASPLSERSRQRSSDSANHYHPHQNAFNKTLEPAIKDYLEDQKRHHRRPKTLEWHEQALG